MSNRIEMSSRLSGKGFQHHQHPKVDDSDDNIFQIKLKQFEACTNLTQNSQSCAMASEKGEEIENNEETTSLYVEKSVLNF